MRYYNIENDEIITEKQMLKDYEEYGKADYETITDYITDCHVRNNGVLVELSETAVFTAYRIDDDNWFEFIEKASWGWHTYYFDFTDYENHDTAKAECEKVIREKFGKDTIIKWTWEN